MATRVLVHTDVTNVRWRRATRGAVGASREVTVSRVAVALVIAALLSLARPSDHRATDGGAVGATATRAQTALVR